MILAETILAYRFATLTLEVNRGRIEEDQIDLAEQVPVLFKEPFFNLILGAALDLSVTPVSPGAAWVKASSALTPAWSRATIIHF